MGWSSDQEKSNFHKNTKKILERSQQDRLTYILQCIGKLHKSIFNIWNQKKVKSYKNNLSLLQLFEEFLILKWERCNLSSRPKYDVLTK